MASINRIKSGQTLYSVERRKAGNTTLKVDVLIKHLVVSVDLERGTVTAKTYGGGSPGTRAYGERHYASWRVSEPTGLRTSIMGGR